jgi:hypothetical protein
MTSRFRIGSVVPLIRFELSQSRLPGVLLSYESFEDLTDDIDDARVFGGIHFRFDQDAGAIQGRQVGAYVATQNLRPLRRWQHSTGK